MLRSYNFVSCHIRWHVIYRYCHLVVVSEVVHSYINTILWLVPIELVCNVPQNASVSFILLMLWHWVHHWFIYLIGECQGLEGFWCRLSECSMGKWRSQWWTITSTFSSHHSDVSYHINLPKPMGSNQSSTPNLASVTVYTGSHTLHKVKKFTCNAKWTLNWLRIVLYSGNARPMFIWVRVLTRLLWPAINVTHSYMPQ